MPARSEYDRIRQLTEWVVEPCDEHGDIVDPQFFDQRSGGRKAALASIPGEFAQFPEVVYVDFAKRVRRGSEHEADNSQDTDVYTYESRHWRDGRVEPITNKDTEDR